LAKLRKITLQRFANSTCYSYQLAKSQCRARKYTRAYRLAIASADIADFLSPRTVKIPRLFPGIDFLAISSSSFSSPLSPSGPGRPAPTRRRDQLAIAPSDHGGRSAPAHRRDDQLLGSAIISGLSGQLLITAASR